MSARFLVVFDVDSTLIEDEAIELLAERSGERERVAEITDRAMRGEIDFSTSLVERVATLKGLPESVLAETAALLRPTKGAAELINLIHERGGKAAAVSGGFIQLLEPLKAKLSLDFAAANTLEVAGGKLTGKLTGEIVDRTSKANHLKKWAAELELPVAATIAVGDGANDLAMMEVAGLSIGFCAKPKVREAADVVLEVRDLAQIGSLLA